MIRDENTPSAAPSRSNVNAAAAVESCYNDVEKWILSLSRQYLNQEELKQLLLLTFDNRGGGGTEHSLAEGFLADQLESNTIAIIE